MPVEIAKELGRAKLLREGIRFEGDSELKKHVVRARVLHIGTGEEKPGGGKGFGRQEERDPRKPVRAKIVDAESVNAVPAEAFLPVTGEPPKGVVQGRIALSDETKGVNLSYNPESYGIAKVETLEEREQRHREELEALTREVERREKEAYERGRREGLKEGREKGRGEVAGELEKIKSLLAAARDETREYFARVEERLVDFAMAIARRVVGETAESHREVAVKLAAEAIREATDRSKLLLIVNPQDYETLKKAKADLRTLSEGIKEIEVETSPRVKPGGLILESLGGSIDAQIETMLDEVYKALKPGYEGANGNGEASP